MQELGSAGYVGNADTTLNLDLAYLMVTVKFTPYVSVSRQFRPQKLTRFL